MSTKGIYGISNRNSLDIPLPRTVSLAAKEDREDMASGPSTFCVWFMLVFGSVLVTIGGLTLYRGREFLMANVVSRKLAIAEGSHMLESWLHPPVQPRLEVYAFNVTNHEDVVKNGVRPVLSEVGPFVYNSDAVKDDAGIEWDSVRGTATYRPRKIYTFVPELSVYPSEFTHKLFLPNLPLLTALNSVQGTFAKSVAKTLVTENGRGTPFIEESVGGLLWGYEDELPCLKMKKPKSCAAESESNEDLFGSDSEDFFGDGEELEEGQSTSTPALARLSERKSLYEGLEKPKAEFVDCKCKWGLFRDRNVTLREPIQFSTGSKNPTSKGIVEKFNKRQTLGWWKPGSKCDSVSGQDSSTFPPYGPLNQTIFIPLLCRSLPLRPVGDEFWDGIRTLRYEPPANALGSHDDSDPAMRNEGNECYCRKDEGYHCFKSGVLNMGPCKRETKTRPPLALSMPHFYGADNSFLDSVEGLSPNKSKHLFYMDLVPELGIPLAIRPRFQLNVVLWNDGDLMKLSQDKIVLPLLWAQDGFGSPSRKLLDKVHNGLGLPRVISVCAGSALVVVGVVTMAVVLYCLLRGSSKVKKAECYQLEHPTSSKAAGMQVQPM